MVAVIVVGAGVVVGMEDVIMIKLLLWSFKQLGEDIGVVKAVDQLHIVVDLLIAQFNSYSGLSS
jgi:hypothetical protein